VTAFPARQSFALSAALLAAAPVVCAAQATSVVTTGVAVGYAYDDNVFWQPANRTDRVLRISPTLRFTRDEPRSNWLGDFSLDAERFTRETSLTTALARQHASITGEQKTGPTSTFGLDAAYDNSITPTDLNLTTGLNLARTRAWRWYAGPNASRQFTARNTARVSYRATGDYAELSPDVITHDAEASLQFDATPRTSIITRYNAQLFDFEAADAVLSHVGRVTWQRLTAAHVRLSLTGGARFTAGEWRPELAAKFARSTTISDASLDYTWTQTTALGIGGLVDVQRVSASAGYHHPNGWSAAVDTGAYFNEIGIERATVYHAGADVSHRIAGPLAIGLTYSFDYQTNPVSGLLSFSPVVPGTTERLPGTVVALIDESLRRNFVLVRFIVSGSRRSAAGPAELPKDGQPQPRTRRSDAN
jgi:hypothetical protein